MKKTIYLLALIMIVLGACRKTTGNEPGNTTDPENTILEGKIKKDLVLKSSEVYKLRGLVYVTDGARLTIEPGTKIVGEKGRNGGLVITRGAKILAEGTREKPIIFTSEESNPQRGDWAGIVLLGKAPTSASFNGQAGIGEIEGGINNSEGLGLYGGGTNPDPADNSGILKYIRIEYAGYAFLPDQEINSLTLGGVGSGTIIDYVQVSYANDDAFEFFGGTVNATHLVAFKTLDDDFDTDNGYSGTVQFGIALRDSAVADISKVESFESDNDANGSRLTPQTRAVFSNMTVVGPLATTSNIGNSLYNAAAQIRRNSSMSLFNSILVGWPVGLLIDASKGHPTDTNIPGTLFFQNNMIAGCKIPVKYAASTSSPTGASSESILDWVNSVTNGNTILPETRDVKLNDAFNYQTPDVGPASGSVALTGASFVNPLLKGMTPVTYRGATGSENNWYKGWTKF